MLVAFSAVRTRLSRVSRSVAEVEFSKCGGRLEANSTEGWNTNVQGSVRRAKETPHIYFDVTRRRQQRTIAPRAGERCHGRRRFRHLAATELVGFSRRHEELRRHHLRP